MPSLPYESVDRGRGLPAILPQPCLILVAHFPTKKLPGIGGRKIGWPALQREVEQSVDP